MRVNDEERVLIEPYLDNKILIQYPRRLDRRVMGENRVALE